jgi:DNA (cytosine-5)-methyltransferase 1
MTQNKTKTVTRKIGLNKGKRRIWLENKVLTDNGINVGMRFNAINGDNRLLIEITPNGDRKIASRKTSKTDSTLLPIIDMSAATITNSFADDVTSVTVIKVDCGLVLVGNK